MSETKKRQVHSHEFKAKVGLKAWRGANPINEIGQAYNVHPVTVGQWKKEIQAHAKTLFEGKRGPTPIAAHREPERLYSEIGKLKMELDGLKKSRGSACHNAAFVDRQRGYIGHYSAMPSGRSIPCYGLCAAKTRACS